MKPNHYSNFDLFHQCVYFYKENPLQGGGAAGNARQTLQAAVELCKYVSLPLEVNSVQLCVSRQFPEIKM